MLPSRLFRNTGIAHPLRSLIALNPSFPASVSVQLRFRLGVGAYYSSTSSHGHGGSQTQTPASSPSTNAASSNADLNQSLSDGPPFVSPTLPQPLGSASQSTPSHTHHLPTSAIEPRMSLTFTCTVPNCSIRSSHTFTKRAYEKGIVLVECPGCKNR
jgi:protein import protein ZIM17